MIWVAPVGSAPASLVCYESCLIKLRDMQSETFDNVFESLCDTAAEAANMKARAELLIGILSA